MTDISGLLKTTMQNENCMSLRAFLFLKGDNNEQLQSSNVSKSTDKSINEQQCKTNG